MPTIISQNIKRLQKLKELTISQLAEKSGVSVRTIERIRSGKHVPDLDTIKKLAKALGQKPEHLVKGAIKKARKQTPLEKGFICYGSPYTPEERKDFTKFERELGQNKEKCFWCGKPSDDKYQITMWAWGQKNVFHICQECENKERKDREARATARAKEIQSIKRQIITAVCLIVITFFIAFYFAL